MNNKEEFIATSIETNTFYHIIDYLKKNNWKLMVEYRDIFDKGIDFDLYQFRKDDETVLMVWNNWFEGEVKATATTLNELAAFFSFTLKFGEPEYAHKPNLLEEMKLLLKFKL